MSMADVITLNEIDEIKNLLTGSIAVIGKTTDTGGTATSGTVMAKLNILLSNNSTLVSANQNHGNIAYTTAGTYTWVCPEGVGEVIVFGSGGTGGGGGGSGGVE